MKLELEDIPSWLRRKRALKKLSIQSLANATGVTRSTISALENGGRKPGLETFMNLLDGLGYELIVRKKDSNEK